MQKAAEALGLPEFDEAALAEKVSRIDVLSHNQLRFLFRDGHSVDIEWENPSRSDSWTEEMKQTARERQMAINERRRKK